MFLVEIQDIVYNFIYNTKKKLDLSRLMISMNINKTGAKK